MTSENREEVSDMEALRRIAARDANAFAVFYDRHAPTIFALALKVTQDKSAAEDVLQEAFWQVWREVGNYTPSRGSPMAWLVQIARSRAIDRLRQIRLQHHRDAGPLEEIAEPFGPAEEGLDQKFIEQQERQIVRQAINNLPEQQRQSIFLVFFGGMTHREVSERLSIPLGTIKTRIRLGLEKLHESLKGSGVNL